MKRADLTVARRNGTGKGAARKARQSGQVPGIIYGGGESPIPVAVDKRVAEHTLHQGGESENILINVKFEEGGGDTLTLVRATQHHPITGDLEHLDFYRVSTDKPITTTVPLQTTGTPKGVREGGVFEQILREVEIECLPLNIPDAIELDVSGLDIGANLHISDIPENPDYTILTAKERTIATITAPEKAVEEKAGEEVEAKKEETE